MMSGYTEDAAPRPPGRRAYRVLQDGCDWRVAVNGCMTRPMASRCEAERLARRLQKEADILRGYVIRAAS